MARGNICGCLMKDTNKSAHCQCKLAASAKQNEVGGQIIDGRGHTKNLRWVDTRCSNGVPTHYYKEVVEPKSVLIAPIRATFQHTTIGVCTTAESGGMHWFPPLCPVVAAAGPVRRGGGGGGHVCRPRLRRRGGGVPALAMECWWRFLRAVPPPPRPSAHALSRSGPNFLRRSPALASYPATARHPAMAGHPTSAGHPTFAGHPSALCLTAVGSGLLAAHCPTA